MTELEELLRAEFRTHPQMNAQDAVKFVYQAVMGCEHLAADPDAVLHRLHEELPLALNDEGPLYTDLGDYVRLHLAQAKKHIDAGMIAALFLATARRGAPQKERLTDALLMVKRLPLEGAEEYLDRYKAERMGAVSHSEGYRRAYAPHYRVIRKEYIYLLPLLEAIQRQKPRIIAIDGPCASGKTTMAAHLQEICDCHVLHMDDFFLPPARKTPERLAEPGGNVDYERFLEQVLLPLKAGKPACFAPFDCSVGHLGREREVPEKDLYIVEGSYSMHPQLRDMYDLSVWKEIADTQQMERIIKRNGPEMASRFKSVWIPLENIYFDQCKVKERCDIVIEQEG